MSACFERNMDVTQHMKNPYKIAVMRLARLCGASKTHLNVSNMDHVDCKYRFRNKSYVIPIISGLFICSEKVVGAFAGKNDFAFGPKDLTSGERMLRFGTHSGGFGGGNLDIALIGIRYSGISDSHASNYIGLANLHKAPVIYLHASSPFRNRPRRAKWNIYFPGGSS